MVVDVAMCVLGKPYQTALTLASLLDCSGAHIGRIYLQEDPHQPFGDMVRYLFLAFPGVDIQQFVSDVAIGRAFFDHRRFREEPAYRRSLRYQRAWDEGPSDFLFISHNDCLYTGDVIGQMRFAMGNSYVGAGEIGQCWNCPAAFASRCSGPEHESFSPTYEEAIEIVRSYPGPRTPEWSIQKDSPAPFPECRLNEFACLIHKSRIQAEIMPQGSIEPFGAMTGDIGTSWFRALRLRGYRFKDFRQSFIHAPFSSVGSGRPGTDNLGLYLEQEARAKAKLMADYPETLDRLERLRSATAAAVPIQFEI